MYSSKIAGIGHYVPENVVTNDDLSKIMDTNDEWITERTGIKERRWIDPKTDDTPSTMGTKAARIAIERAGITPDDIDFIIFATLSPDYYLPGPGVMVQDQLGIKEIGALDVRNQCSGFVYSLSIADQFIKSIFKDRFFNFTMKIIKNIKKIVRSILLLHVISHSFYRISIIWFITFWL